MRDMSTTTPLVEITVNGERRQAPRGQTVPELLASLEIPADRVAIELNREILKKDRWESTRLAGGEELEIVHFVGGG